MHERVAAAGAFAVLDVPGHDKTMLAVSPDGSLIAAGGYRFVELFCRAPVAP